MSANIETIHFDPLPEGIKELPGHKILKVKLTLPIIKMSNPIDCSRCVLATAITFAETDCGFGLSIQDQIVQIRSRGSLNRWNGTGFIKSHFQFSLTELPTVKSIINDFDSYRFTDNSVEIKSRLTWEEAINFWARWKDTVLHLNVPIWCLEKRV